MRLILIACFISATAAYSQDSLVILPKKTALFYYQEHLRADYLANKNRLLTIKLDTTNSIIKEQKTQLSSSKEELGGLGLRVNAMAELLTAANDNVDIGKIKLKVMRRQRNLFIISTTLFGVSTIAILVHQFRS